MTKTEYYIRLLKLQKVEKKYKGASGTSYELALSFPCKVIIPSEYAIKEEKLLEALEGLRKINNKEIDTLIELVKLGKKIK